MIAKELRRRGFEVVFAGESAKTAFLREEGFEVIPVFEPDPEKLFESIRKGRLRFASDAVINRMIEADLSVYEDVRPALVLTDGRFTAAISTQIAQLKHVAIVNVSSTQYRALPYVPLLDFMPERFLKSDTRLRKLLDLFNLKLEMLVFDNVMRIFKRLSRKHGLKKEVTATNCLAGKDLTLLADIPEYFPTRNLPADYHDIGPMTLKSNTPPPVWWPLERHDRPLVYITMGTTGIGDFFEIVHELLKNSDMTAVMTTGGQVDKLKNINGHVYVENYIDGDLVVDACDVVVCHGGNGTIYQALLHGKPVIGLPTIPDQAFNMRRVEAVGVGKSLAWAELLDDPNALLDVIDTVLRNTSFLKNTQEMQKILKTYQGEKMGADIIERYFLNSRD